MVRYLELILLAAALLAVMQTPSAAQSSLGKSQLPPAQEAGALSRASKKPFSTKDRPIGKDGSEFFVVGGSEAPQFRYVVGISFFKQGNREVCSGTLLSKNLVLTAAHCGCGNDYSITQNLKMLGGKYLRVIDPPILFDTQICQTSRILPGFDLALLRLAEPANVEDNYNAIPPIAFSLAPLLYTGNELIAVGYGLTENRTAGVRMMANIPIFTSDCAQRQYLAAGCAPFLEMILSASARVSGNRNVDTCSGDSGGPIFVMRDDNGSTMPVLVGVTSRPAPFFHLDAENHCGGGGFYTVVGRTDVIAWLRKNGAVEPFLPTSQSR